MDKENSVVDTIKTVIYAIIVAIVIRTFLFEPFKIPSASMYPTLYVGDYLFVSKYTYGYSKHSFPMSAAPFSGKILSDVPNRGEVVVFKPTSDEKNDYIKRVIGLPGDKIKIIEDRLYINDKLVEREQIEDFIDRDKSGNIVRYKQFVEVLPGGVKHNILQRSDKVVLENYPEVTIPENMLFMMGDNRDNSEDSRKSVGYVPLENLVGRARVLFFSHENEGAWYKPWTWPKMIRWKRIFTKIQ